MYLYVKDLFLKVYSDFAILAIFGEFWLNFWGCYFTYGSRKNLFFYRKSVSAIFREFGVNFL